MNSYQFTQEEREILSRACASNRERKHKGTSPARLAEIAREVENARVALGFSSKREMFDFAGRVGDFRRYAYNHARVENEIGKGIAIPVVRKSLLRARVAESAGRYSRKYTRGTFPRKSSPVPVARKSRKGKGRK